MGRTTLARLTPGGRTAAEAGAAALGEIEFGVAGLADPDRVALVEMLTGFRAAAGDFRETGLGVL